MGVTWTGRVDSLSRLLAKLRPCRALQAPGRLSKAHRSRTPPSGLPSRSAPPTTLTKASASAAMTSGLHATALVEPDAPLRLYGRRLDRAEARQAGSISLLRRSADQGGSPQKGRSRRLHSHTSSVWWFLGTRRPRRRSLSQASASVATLPDFTAAQRAAWSLSVWSAYSFAKSAIATSKRSLLPR
jgi:hypothetical protein